MRIVGLDIGGANLKAANGDGICVCLPFPLWKQQERLEQTLRELPAEAFGHPDLVALTMTGELADCFPTKREGVELIIDAVRAAFPDSPVRVWMTSGEFAAPDDARELPRLVAAANWHVLATWAGRAVPAGPALLIDVGSTTTDLIPIVDGLPASVGTTDLERLQNRELLYTGARRTPVCAMVSTVTWRGGQVPVAAELFAAALDVHLLTGEVPEDETCCDTADGRPATRQWASNRLAHMLCSDTEEISEEDLTQIAGEIADRQIQQIADAASDRLNFACEAARELAADAGTPGIGTPVVIVSGSGQFLAERALMKMSSVREYEVMNLSGMYRPAISEAACAFAAARLCADRCLDDLLPLQHWSL